MHAPAWWTASTIRVRPAGSSLSWSASWAKESGICDIGEVLAHLEELSALLCLMPLERAKLVNSDTPEDVARKRAWREENRRRIHASVHPAFWRGDAGEDAAVGALWRMLFHTAAKMCALRATEQRDGAEGPWARWFAAVRTGAPVPHAPPLVPQ